MAKRKFKKTIEKQYRDMTPEQMSERWRMMRPRYYKWLGMFSLAIRGRELANHF